MNFPWWSKVLLLLAGTQTPWIGLPLIMADGVFHGFSSAAELKNTSPDWIIARELLDGRDGLGVWVHRVIGLFLFMTASAATVDLVTSTLTGRSLSIATRVYLQVTLIIISVAIALKALAGGYQDQRVAFFS